MGNISDLVKNALLSEAKIVYKNQCRKQSVKKIINACFSKFEKSSCVKLDYDCLEKHIVDNLNDAFQIYRNPSSSYVAEEEKYIHKILGKFPSLPHEDMEVIKYVCTSVLGCVEEISLDCLSENEKIMLNRQLALFDTKESENTSEFQKMLNRIINPDNRHVLLSYDSNDIFLARDDEESFLQDFVDSNDTLLFCVVSGPGGSGKNKLVYSFLNTSNIKANWDYRFIDSSCVERFCDLKSWDCERNMCLIFDDVDVDYKSLKKWFELLFSHDYKCEYKLRIILLARGYADITNSHENNLNKFKEERFEGYPDWFRYIIDSGFPIKEKLFAGRFLVLPDMSLYDACSLVRAYFYYRKKRPISNEEMALFVKILSVKDNAIELLRPLFILAAVETYIMRPNVWSDRFDLSNVYQMIYERNCRSWYSKIRNKELYGSLKRLYAYATIIGELDIKNTPLPVFLQKDADILFEEKLCSNDNLFAKLFEIVSDSPSDGNILKKYVPDLLGEYFVLKVLDALSPREFKEWMIDIIRSENSTLFMCRVISDYADNDLFSELIQKIILCQIDLMETAEENANVSSLVGKYFSIYPFDMSEHIRSKLNEKIELIKEYYCWTEVYMQYIIEINEDRTLSFLQKCYPEVMTICRRWDLYDKTLLASKTMIMLGELLRHTISEFSTSNSENTVILLEQYEKDFLFVKNASNENDPQIKESLITAESKILDTVYSLSKNKLFDNDQLKDFSSKLESDLVTQFAFFINGGNSVSALNKLIESTGRILISPSRSELYDRMEWLTKIVTCISTATDSRVCWFGVPILISIAVSTCIYQRKQIAKESIKCIFTCVGNLKRRAISGAYNDNASLYSHIERSVQRFYSSDLIEEKYRVIASVALDS